MWLETSSDEYDAQRRAPRVGIELPVRCKHGTKRSTVMLKDLNPYGARIEGLDKLRIDEPIYLMLPGLQPKLAFVVLIVILQLWLLNATMNAYLGGDTSTVVPAAVASLACLGLNGGLLWYLFGLEK